MKAAKMAAPMTVPFSKQPPLLSQIVQGFSPHESGGIRFPIVSRLPATYDDLALPSLPFEQDILTGKTARLLIPLMSTLKGILLSDSPMFGGHFTGVNVGVSSDQQMLSRQQLYSMDSYAVGSPRLTLWDLDRMRREVEIVSEEAGMGVTVSMTSRNAQVKQKVMIERGGRVRTVGWEFHDRGFLLGAAHLHKETVDQWLEGLIVEIKQTTFLNINPVDGQVHLSIILPFESRRGLVPLQGRLLNQVFLSLMQFISTDEPPLEEEEERVIFFAPNPYGMN
jgi:hypothetical protein